MSVLRVNGPCRLEGEIEVQGSKNSALPILAACVMAQDPVMLRRCPEIADVENMRALLKGLGCTTYHEDRGLVVEAAEANCHTIPEGTSRELRSSIFMLGPILVRFKKAVATYPGGCEIGKRPIDLHIKGLRLMGADIREEGELIICDGRNMRGARIELDFPSVGATENLMLAAALTDGITEIKNAAREPEIEDLQHFVNAMGGKVRGAGSECILIEGVKKLSGCEYTVMPDRIVTGTYMAAAAITAGDVRLTGIEPAHVGALTAKLKRAGAEVNAGESDMRITAPRRLKSLGLVETQPYPGFPTDLQAQVMALACVASGTSVIVENIFESRYRHTSELVKMGARIGTRDRTAVGDGVRQLEGARLAACDLRAGAALTIAGLRARGETIIEGAEYIDRGYESLDGDLNSLGADIERL